MNYVAQRNESDRYLKHFQELVKKHASIFIETDIADEYKDTNESTDMIMFISKPDIALRVRSPKYSYRDITIRSRSKYGGKTEIDKLREGYGDWYFYGWGDGRGKILEYVIADIDKIRRSGLLENKIETLNNDGTAFITIDIADLFWHKAIPEGGYQLTERTKDIVRQDFEVLKRRQKRYG